MIIDSGYTRLRTQIDIEPCLVAGKFLNLYLDTAEQPLVPKALGCLRDFIAGYLHTLPYLKA